MNDILIRFVNSRWFLPWGLFGVGMWGGAAWEQFVLGNLHIGLVLAAISITSLILLFNVMQMLPIRKIRKVVVTRLDDEDQN